MVRPMRYGFACVLALFLVAGCSKTSTHAQDFTNSYYYASAEANHCVTVMTISGGAKRKCDN